MRLLDKKTANTEVADQRKKLIDEGLTLARKVDVLRETVVKEEGNLHRFRIEAVPSVQKEIDEKIKQKDSLRDEIKVLEKKREELQKPLDDEWVRVNQAKELINGLKQGLYEREDELIEAREEFVKVKKEVEEDKSRAKDLTRRASEKLAEADETLKDAREDSVRLRTEANALLSSAGLRERAASLKEQDIITRVSEVAMAWNKVREKEIDLANRERALKDKYQTLERTIKRMK